MWHKTLDDNLRSKPGISQIYTDPALYFKISKSSFIGRSGSSVGNMLRAGTNGFNDLCSGTPKRFKSFAKDSLRCIFSGFQVKKYGNELAIDQEEYLKKLKHLPDDAFFLDFCSSCMKLLWLTHTCPDIQFEVSQVAQITA